MKFLCESCERLGPPAGFRVEGAALVLACARCGAESRCWPGGDPGQAGGEAGSGPGARSPQQAPPLKVVSLRPSGERVREAAELARSGDPFAVPAGFCPKCIAPRPEGALSCRQCGLVFDNFIAAEHRPSEPLAAAWLAVLGQWDDRGAHDRFLSLALARSELAAAGRLYRLRLAQAPDDLYAQRGRDEVLRLASASSGALAEGPPIPASPRSAFALALVFLLLVLLAGVLLFRHLLDGG